MGRGRSAPPGVWFRTESGILHINNSELRSFSPSWPLQFSKPLRHPTHHPRTHPNLLVLLYLLHVDLSIYLSHIFTYYTLSQGSYDPSYDLTY